MLAALEAGRIAGHDIRPVVPFLLYIDPGRGHAARAGIVGDFARLDRLQQDGEPAAMSGVFRFDPDQRRLVLERL